jgi:hypothetical protein
MGIKESDIRAKFCYTTKLETRNLLIEVGSETRKKPIQAKLKLCLAICRVNDYIVAKRCFRYSRYNHNFRDFKGEETCPMCIGSHKLRNCTAAKSEYKCINYFVYDMHHQPNQIDIAHSFLAVLVSWRELEKYKKNPD